MPPQGAVEHERVQATPLLVGSPVTVAVTCIVPPSSTVLDGAATDTATDGTVIDIVAVLVLSVAEAAVRVTVKLLAEGVPGAV